MRNSLSLKGLRLVSREAVEGLLKMGVHSLWELVELALTPSERRALARRAGVNKKELEELVRVADMCRVADSGLAELLVKAGVYTPLELPLRRSETLYAMVEGAAKRFGLKLPDLAKLKEAKERALNLAPLFRY